MLLVGSFNDLGMIESLNHFIPKFLSQEKYQKARSFLIYAGVGMLLTSILSSLLLWNTATWLGTVYFGDVQATTIIQFFCLYLVFSNILHWISNIFIIYQNTKFCKGIDFLRMLTSLGFAFQIYHAGNGTVEQYAEIWNYGVILATVFGMYYVWKLHLRELFQKGTNEFVKKDFIELFQYSMWALLASNVGHLLSQIDIQLLLLMRGTTEVGIYSNYLSLIGIPFLLLTPIIGLIFPVVSAYFGANRMGEIRTITSTFSRLFSLLGLLAISMGILYASWSGIFFFGEKFKESGIVLLYSIGFLIFNFLLAINFNILAAVGKVKKRLVIISKWLVVNIVLNIIFIHYMGAEGSAFAVGVSWIFIWYLSYLATQEYHEPFLWKNFLKNLIFCTMLTITLWEFIPRNIEMIGRWGYFFSMVVSTIIFIVGFAILNKTELLNIYRTFKNTSPWAPPIS